MPELVPRDLKPSTSLLCALERCRQSTVKGVKGKRRDKPVIDAPQLLRLEDTIGTRLHDDVFTLIALDDPLTKLLTGLECTLTIETAADDFASPQGHVCIAVVYSEPIQELQDGSHGGPHYELMAPISKTGDDPKLRVHLDGTFEGEMTAGEFLDRMLAAASTGGVSGIAAERDVTPAPLDPCPRIIPGLTVVREPLGRAMHKKFGEGTIIRRIEDGPHEKLVIAFTDRQRTLLASYVELMS